MTSPAKLVVRLPRLAHWLGRRDLQATLWIPDYFYTAHVRILGGIPFNAGWMQGLGFVVVEMEWKR